MTSVRLVLAAGFAVDIFALFADWLAAEGGNSFTLGFTLPDLFSQQRVPATVSSAYYSAYASSVVAGHVSGDLTLLVAFVAFALSLLIGLAALFRWPLSLASGALALLGAALWLAGVPAVAPDIVAALKKWPGFAGTIPGIGVGASVGPYLALVGGIILVLAYVLAKAGRLDY